MLAVHLILVFLMFKAIGSGEESRSLYIQDGLLDTATRKGEIEVTVERCTGELSNKTVYRIHSSKKVWGIVKLWRRLIDACVAAFRSVAGIVALPPSSYDFKVTVPRTGDPSDRQVLAIAISQMLSDASATHGNPLLEETLPDGTQVGAALAEECERLAEAPNRHAKEKLGGVVEAVLGELYDPAYVSDLVDQYGELEAELVDHSDDFLRYISRRGLDIQPFLASLDAAERERYGKMIADVLMFTCLHSVQEREETAYLSLFSMEGALRILNTLKADVELHPVLQGVADLESYNELNIPQKILTLSTLRAAPPGTERTILQNPVYIKMREAEALMSFLYTVPTASEQYWLNTCAAAAFNQKLMLNVSAIPALLVIEEELVARARRKCASLTDEQREEVIFKSALGFGGTARGDYVTRRIDRVEREFQEARREFLSKDPVSEADVAVLLEGWNHQMQMLSAVIDVENPVYLSKKLIKGQWLLSAVLSAVPGVIAGVAGRYPAPLTRHEGIDVDRLEIVFGEVLGAGNVVSSSAAHLQVIYDLVADGGKPYRRDVVDLWHRLLEKGGSRFGTSGHSLFLRAVTVGGERQFALTDPKGSTYSFHTIDELPGLLKRL